ncbi:MAG: YmfQ family protein [Candidatus Hamiltonella defensa (Ceratovacuna japonica)]|uniref:YmfQ family protein n=1 Tax=Candidatus Williamhamiltonella defendens TaxID=138072 RepID=UPI00158262A3|nr:putative phage tail protein [Candidatus Hamiltonella defensa]
MPHKPNLDEDYTRLLQSLLPPGPAWAGDTPLLAGLAPSLARVHQRADDLMREINPAQSMELTDRYDTLCGLPDPCLDPRPQTREERQQILDAKVNTVGGMHEGFFLEQLRLLGYPTATLEQCQHLDRSPDPAWGDRWRYYWRVHIPAEAKIRTMTALSACDSPLRHWGERAVECVIERLCPSHTQVLFAYPKGDNHASH